MKNQPTAPMLAQRRYCGSVYTLLRLPGMLGQRFELLADGATLGLYDTLDQAQAALDAVAPLDESHDAALA